MKANAVFEGGGVRGIGIIGALSYMESIGYEWNYTAGTSVGSIVAALIAAGYSAKEMKKIMIETDYTKFLDHDMIQGIPLLGKLIGVFKENAVYSGDYFESWLNAILKKRNINTFKDLSCDTGYRLKVIAADITKKSMLTLPDDLPSYGIDPDSFPVASAVRMSMSLPFYFKPVKLKHKGGISFIVDGGICCNFPITIFDTPEIQKIPTFGFKFKFEDISNTSKGKTDTFSFLCDIASTMSGNNDNVYMLEENMARTIFIPTVGVEATQFDITKEKALELFRSGYRSSHDFIKTWNYEDYIRRFKENAITA